MPGPVVLAAPAFALVGMLIVITGATGAPPPPVGCGPAGASVTVGETTLDAEQAANASTIVGVTAGRGCVSTPRSSRSRPRSPRAGCATTSSSTTTTAKGCFRSASAWTAPRSPGTQP